MLAAARQGEQWAWTRIYQELAGPVRGYLAGRGSPEPEDEAAETFLAIARSLHTFEGDEGAFRSWVFSIAHRRMIDAHRKAVRRPAPTLEEDSLERFMRDLAPSAEHEAERRRSAEEAAALLEGLTPDQREILLLRVVGDLSVRDTSRLAGKSESAVRVAQHRAIASLRERALRRPM